jgi:hypothetical protein
MREQFPSADRSDIQRLLDELVEPVTTGTARVELPTFGAARLRDAARQRTDGTWEVDYTDVGILVADVLEAGGTILDPPDAAEAQLVALNAVAGLHGGLDA